MSSSDQEIIHITSVTELIKHKNLRNLILSKVNIKPVTKATSLEREKNLKISPSLRGSIAEYSLLLKLSMSDMTIRQEFISLFENLIAEIESKKTSKLKDNCQTLFTKTHIYETDFEDLLKTHFKHLHNVYNFLYNDRGVQPRYNGYFNFHSIIGNTFIHKEDYYNSILFILIEFKNRLIDAYKSESLNSLLNNDGSLLLFIQALKLISDSKWGRMVNPITVFSYSLEDVDNIRSLMAALFEMMTDNYENYEFQSHFEVEVKHREFHAKVLASVDFLSAKSLLEIKATKTISINHFLQVLLYYVIISYSENPISIPEQAYIFYPLKQYKHKIDFKTIASDSIKEIYHEMCNTVIGIAKRGPSIK